MYLRYLDLSGNEDYNIFRSVSLAIEEIYLQHSKLGDHDIADLVKHLPKWKRLEKLDLSDNNIATSVNVLADAIPQKIKILKIKNNPFNVEEMNSIMEILPTLMHLEELTLSILPYEKPVFELFCKVFPQCKHLKEFHVFGATKAMDYQKMMYGYN